MRAWKLHFSGEVKIDPHDPIFDPAADPVERIVADTEHHLFARPETGKEVKPYHMPIQQILPQILEHRRELAT